ncbi:hypothetical protein ACRQ5B_09425 [Pseudarthrobacter sp. L19]|uniref:hypothetical protein n=1 Tax=Pseudarthrobacter sp. L19 TaxID=3423951 RepID=UPI003D78B9BB
MVSNYLGRRIPEVVHRYPSYRFDIARGRVSRGDRQLISELEGTVARLVDEFQVHRLFCPVGVGLHVDHLITRRLGEAFSDRVVYYSDFPYDQQQRPDNRFLQSRKLTPWVWQDRIVEKQDLIRKYATQVDALFAQGHIPLAPETYYLPA